MAFGQVNKVVNYTWRFTDADKMQQAMVNIERAAGVAVIAIAGAMTALTVSSVKAASAFVEMENQFAVVFGESAPQARAELDAFADSIGRSSNRMMGYAAAIQDTFVPLGVARDEAAALSVQAVQLATDLSSFKNIDMEDTVTSITAALAGQHRSVQRLGIVIRESTLDQELWNMGIDGGFRAATEAEKVIARYNLMLQASQDAQGDATRTSGEFENQIRVLEDAWYDTRVEIGQEVIPIIEELIPDILELMEGFKETATVAIPQIIEAFTKMAPVIIDTMGLIGDFIGLLGTAAEGWNMIFDPSRDPFELALQQQGAEGYVNVLERLTPLLVRASEAQGNYNSNRDNLLGVMDALWGTEEATVALVESTDNLGGSAAVVNEEWEKSLKLLLEMSSLQKAPAIEAEQMALDSLAKRQLITEEIGRSELERAQQMNDLYMQTAYDFGRAMKSDGLDLLDLVKQIGLEFARMQLGKAAAGGMLGGVFNFLGGFL